MLTSQAAFASRPFALLEIKSYPMPRFFFAKYYQTAYALDTWTYGYYPGPKEHRRGRSEAGLRLAGRTGGLTGGQRGLEAMAGPEHLASAPVASR